LAQTVVAPQAATDGVLIDADDSILCDALFAGLDCFPNPA